MLSQRSIKTRVTLFTLGIFVGSIWALSLYASRMLQIDMQRVLGEQQLSTTSFIADDINDDLTNRIKALEAVAASVSPATMGDAAAAQRLLEERPVLHTLFNGGVIIGILDGTAIAEVPRSNGRIGTNYIHIDYVAAVLKDGKATIGKPIVGPKLKAPIIGMGVPLRDAQGKVIGALFGVIRLDKPSFLDKLTEGQYGKTGGYLLVAPKQRIIVTATDKARIMEQLPPPGVSPLIDRFIQGYEGTGIFVNPVGVEVIQSSKGVPMTGWYVGAQLPVAEAFAPIHQMRQRMLWATIFLTLLAAALTWWMLRRELAPMLHTVKALTLLATSDQAPQALPIARQDEIGKLIGGFNHLLGTLAQRDAALQLSASVFRHAREGIMITTPDGTIIDVNAAFTRITGYTREDVIGQNPRILTSGRHDASYFATMWANLLEHGYWDGEIWNRRKDGEVFAELQTISAVRDAGGAVQHYVSLFSDISERKTMEDQVRQMAYVDALTGLPNRRMFGDRLSQAMATSKRSGLYAALMFLDLDNFKPLNDAHGHGVGDLLLIEVAARLTECLREVDTVARFGGDEFVVMLSELDTDKALSTEQAAGVAEKIRTSLAVPYSLTESQPGQPDKTIEHRCSVSIGVVLFVNHEDGQTDLMKWADAAMYQAKEAGRDRVQFFS